ncbi:Gfo/Idh/MocA family oxidoreductase [Steroidobacter sp.]|uniref:Gfo/Idh/MocA family protein n=1 Tax=Steroidobacter sp. TaxID=1978227 RepID=UPI0032C2336A
MSKVEIVVAGAGAIGRRHVELIQRSERCRLLAIVDPADAAAELAARAGVPIYSRLADMLSNHRPGGVVLATPNAVHVENALECIKAGVATLVEKPVAHSVAAAMQLCEAVEAAGGRLLVGHHRAHSPVLARAREVVRAGLLGTPVAVVGTALFCKPDAYFEQAAWRKEPGGGPILINMIHEIGNLRSLCGEITSVHAFASNFTRRFSVEDTVAINLRFANGALGTFMLSDTAGSARSWEQTSGEDPAYPTHPDEDCYLIAGTCGSLAIPTMRLRRYEREEDRSWWKPFATTTLELRRADPLQCQLEHFCAVIRGEAEPLVTARDGLQNLRVVEAISAAAQTGRVIEIVTDPRKSIAPDAIVGTPGSSQSTPSPL